MIKLRSLAVWLSMAVYSSGVIGQHSECDQSLSLILDRSPHSVSLNEVKKLENECEGTGIYELTLLNALLYEEKYQEAKLVAVDALEDRLPYKNQFQRSVVDIDFMEARSHDTTDKMHWTALKRRYQELLSSGEFEGDYLVYLRMAEIDVETNSCASALDNIKHGLKLERVGRFYSLLVICYHNMGDHDAVLRYLEQAYLLNPHVFKEVDTMVAISASYAENGDLGLAKRTLIKLAQVNPGSKSTKAFGDAVNYLERLVSEKKSGNLGSE